MKKSSLFLLLPLLIVGCGGGSSAPSSIIIEEDKNNNNFSDSFDFSTIENNPHYKNSWHIYPSDDNRDINVTSAWKSGITGKNIKVAIIDYGFGKEQEDIKSAYFYQKDIDNNSDVTYDDHGTMCAGLIGARSNDSGSLGVAPTSKLYFLQSNLDNGQSSSSQTIQAINTAKNLGVDILNNSWGSYQVDDSIRDTINDLATNGRDGKGMIIIFASGNDNCNLDSYCSEAKVFPNDESELENVIGVGSSNKNNSRSTFSNYGKNLDIVAPGEDILSTYKNNEYRTSTGTSYSAPIVAGVVALILDQNPNLTFTQVKSILQESATKIGNKEDYDSSGHNIFYGYGKVNAGAAVELAKNY